MSFKLAQTFYIDRTSVRDSESVTLTSIDLYFKSKPMATANRSGIVKPGVTITILETKDNDIPNIDAAVSTAISRNDYDSIVATADASIVTKFNFSRPVILTTNKSYAIAVTCDGDEDFVLWACKEGENIVGTNKTTAGAAVPNVGKYYEYTTPTAANSQGQWKPLNNVDLKFTVFCGVFASNTTSTAINTTYILPSDPSEYIMFDRYDVSTSNWANAAVGDMVYQETPVLYGPITVSSNSTTVTATGNVNFSQLLTVTSTQDDSLATDTPKVNQKSYIVLRNGTSQSANVVIREVVSIVSNTEITVDSFPNFTSNLASFSVTAAGRIVDIRSHWYTGRWWDSSNNTMTEFSNRRTDLLCIGSTNANSTVRFVNNSVLSIAINSGGLGYSNSDVVTVYPVLDANTADPDHINYIESYANAVANVVTNGSGTITGIAVTNPGYGLISNVAVSIATTGGTIANLEPSVGSLIKTVSSNAVMSNTVVTNIETHSALPTIKMFDNQHHDYTAYQHYPYYVLPDTQHVLRKANTALVREVNSLIIKPVVDITATDGRKYVLASRSNEVAMSGNVSIQVSNGSIVSLDTKSSSMLEVKVSSNNAFTIPMVESDAVYNYAYIINNDATNEHKGNGAALARHISTKVSFDSNRDAEDVLVYLDAYRPAGTNIKVYARIHNRSDSEAFDDKDWSELELKSNNASAYSSLTDKNDLVEFSYGLPTVPPSVNTLTGFATAQISNSTIVGVGTDFVTDLEVGDVVKIYSSLFPENYQVSVVQSIANTTQIVLEDAIDSTDLTGSSVVIDFIGRSGATEIGRPHSAWSNAPNSYICRYYDSNMAVHDTYSSFTIKIVLLSDNKSIVPEIENCRALGVSA